MLYDTRYGRAAAVLDRLRAEAGKLAVEGLAQQAHRLTCTAEAGRELGWPGWSYAMLAASGPAFGAFAWWQRRNAAPGASRLVAPALFGHRSCSLGLVAGLLLFASVSRLPATPLAPGNLGAGRLIRAEDSQMTTSIPPEVQAYIDGISPGHRPLFDRLHRLILTAHPGATVTLSYKMPAYQAGKRRIYVGAWKHGISLYGWGKDRDGGFTARHPGLVTSTGTIQLRPEDAAGISDEEFLTLVRAVLAR